MKNRFVYIVLCLLLVLSCLLSCKNDPTQNETDFGETVHDPVDSVIQFQTVSETSTAEEDAMLPEHDLRIISMNLSTELRDMENRGPMMIKLLNSYEPDSIGTQENSGYSEWVEYLEEGLPNYEHVGICGDGHEDSTFYNSNYIYYNADKYTCVDWYTFWPSRTTTQIASSYALTYPRTCTWAILENIETGFKYVHINCHLAFETDAENIFQISIIRDLMNGFARLGIPVFTTGDFNTSEGSYSYDLITASEYIDDPKHLADHSMSSGSFRGWGDRDLTGGRPIDYCFVTGSMMDVHEYEVIDTYRGGVAITDHCGIFVSTTVNSMKDPYINPVTISTEGMVLTELSRTVYHYDFEFAQADDLRSVHQYHVELLDAEGNIVDERDILTKHLDELVSDTKRCTFTSLKPDTQYTVKLYAVSLIGTRSDPLVFSFTTLPLK